MLRPAPSADAPLNPKERVRLNARAATDVARRTVGRSLFPSFPGTKNIRLHPYFRGGLSRWAWRIYTHRLTRAGRWTLGLTLIVGLSLAPGLDVQFFVPFVYLIAFWITAEIASLLNRPIASLRSRHADRVRAGETLWVEVTMTWLRRRWPGLDLNLLPARLPLEVDAVPGEGVPVGTLLPGESRRVRVGLSCPRRGVYRLWGWRLESDFPFGLLNAYQQVADERTLLVYPAFRPLERMDLPTGTRYQQGGVLLAAHRGDSFEYLGNREFREGDNVRDIDWRATARFGGEPIALREWREEYFVRVGVVLDTYLLRGGSRVGAERTARREAAFERAVSLCAAIADYLSRQDFLVDIFAAGPTLYHLTAGRSLAYLDQILDILACVETSDQEPLEVIAPQINEYAAQLTTVLCVFLAWNEERRLFVEGLQASGAGVKVILVHSGEGDDALFAPLPPDATIIAPTDWQDDGVDFL